MTKAERAPDQAPPKSGSRKGQRQQLPWREDPAILARLPQVERGRIKGRSNVALADELAVDESTIREDIKRLNKLWLETIKADQQALRAEAAAELRDVQRRAIAAAEFDEAMECAVLLDDPVTSALYDQPTRIHRDNKGAAQFRGNKSGNLGVARQAIMDRAKLLGLVIDKQEIAGRDGAAIPIRIVEVVPPDGGAGESAQD